jgi:hypothetical protein
VEIYERSGKIYGKIVDIVEKSLCTACSARKNKPVMGLVIIKGLKKGKKYNDGKILDPTGKLYKCFLALEGHD